MSHIPIPALLQVCSDAAHLEHRHSWAAAPGGTEQEGEQLEDFRDVLALPLLVVPRADKAKLELGGK